MNKYGPSITRVQKAITTLTSRKSSLSNIDFDSFWSGKAHDKQLEHRTNLIDTLNNSINDLTTLQKALEELNAYDNIVSQISNWQSVYNNCSEDEKAKKENAYNQLQNARQLKNDCANTINDLLNEITTVYDSQINAIDRTEVINTNDTFANIYNTRSNISNNFEISQYVKPSYNQTPTYNNTYAGATQTSYLSSVSYAPATAVATTAALSNTNNTPTNTNNTPSNTSNNYQPSAPGSNNYNANPNFNNTDAWVTKNPYSQSGLYGQCTWFAWGKFYEMYGYDPGFRGNGKDCAYQLASTHPNNFEISNYPTTGAVFSYQGYPYGHVGIITEVKDGMLTYQDGNYDGVTNSFAVAQGDWGTRTVSVQDFINRYGGKVVFANPINNTYAV